MPQVARNIAHRLRIVTSLASVVTEHRRQILAGLQFFNDAYAVTASKNRAPGGWVQSGVPASCGMVATCDHVADVYHALSNPRFRLEAALTASMHSLSQDVYARTQEAGGLRFYRLRGIMREYRAGLLRVADFAPSIFAATMAEAEKYYPIEEESLLLLLLRRPRRPLFPRAQRLHCCALEVEMKSPSSGCGAGRRGTRNKRTSSKSASEKSEYWWVVLPDARQIFLARKFISEPTRL